ncbi:MULTISPECIES: acetyl-CoA C-acyltransferase [Phenylobacterium]|uniref:Acetyl-CoA C-acetyltransferase/acetyl-CoA acyltransferase n=1 Tax=Phenylobacterium koreense TaxID=266125 RepID=A0ABV2EGU6_9CAUL
MADVFIVPGVRTPFVKAGAQYADVSALQLSAPIAKAMINSAQPDLLLWGQVIPDPTVSNVARELVFEAGLDPEIVAFSDVMACSTSFIGALAAGGLLGRGDAHLALVGGVETMSHRPIALRQGKADQIAAKAIRDLPAALQLLEAVTPADFEIPANAWANRVSGRSMGEHTEDTAKLYAITRAAQDALALASHQNAARGRDQDGFFGDLVLPAFGVEHDTLPRTDTSLEKLSALPTVFDRTGAGTLTAGNSSPLTDGAAGVWVADADGLRRLGGPPAVRLVDWQLAAMSYAVEGILMAPARAIPRLLARHGLKAADVAVWELHEAFAAQVLANIQAAMDPSYRREHAKIDVDLGPFPFDRLNRHGGSLALGHPFAATGARILSQAAKELLAHPVGAKAVVSVCADGGQGTVALLERV